MACAACGKRRNNRQSTIVNEGVGVDFTKITPKTTTVRSVRGALKIDKSLLQGRPIGGWKINVLYKNVSHSFTGDSYDDIFNQVRTFYRDNDVEIDDSTIHFNLNLYWTERQLVKNAIVAHKDLQSIKIQSPLDSSLQPFMVKENGSKDWNYIGRNLALNKDEYDKKIFINLLQHELTLLQLDSIGCPECAEHFAGHLMDALESGALDTRDKARRWMWGVMNKINESRGLNPISFEQASWKHNWITEDITHEAN